MPTTPLSRPVGARVGAAAVLAGLTVAGTAWIGAPAAFAAPGDGGDLRIHRVGTPVGVPRDDARVCRFYLDATNFDGAGSTTYTIVAQPPLPNTPTLSGTLTLAAGVGHTEPLALAEGQYKLTWTVAGVGIPQTEKIFRVECREGEREGGHGERDGNDPQGGDRGNDSQGGGRSEQGGGEEGPRGGVHAGGGGLAHMTGGFSPLAATATVGLVVGGGVAYLRLIRRRPDGAA
ncbi:hypothetical protein ACFY93_03210 [Streptomyces sp. NPDC008313]|uniref:hypothetical protein n=1 Tax=Streptomyces sp. NPDC008313 TaxID=3364826 RepID=UPI0036DFD0C0